VGFYTVLPKLFDQNPNRFAKATGNNDVPTHLNNLYEDTVKDMSINKKEKVRDLLYKYSDIFSQNDSDFGRTTLVRQYRNPQNLTSQRTTKTSTIHVPKRHLFMNFN
jgi:hypothetical protein